MQAILDQRSDLQLRLAKSDQCVSTQTDTQTINFHVAEHIFEQQNEV